MVSTLVVKVVVNSYKIRRKAHTKRIAVKCCRFSFARFPDGKFIFIKMPFQASHHSWCLQAGMKADYTKKTENTCCNFEKVDIFFQFSTTAKN